MGLNLFLITTTIVMFLGSVFWSKHTKPDLIIKILLLGLGIWGILVTANRF